MDGHGLAITLKEVLDHSERPDESTESGPGHFVCNADELRHQEWANQHRRICFDPVFHPGGQMGYPVSRAAKRIALLACNAADGSPAMLLVIIPRKTIEKELWLTGMTPGEVMTRSESKGHIEIAIFEEGPIEILLPELQRRRGLYACKGRALMILDNCSSHGQNDLMHCGAKTK